MEFEPVSLNTKYREGTGKPPEDFVHTLNSTALATSRIMIAILEQCQRKDGSVTVPSVLRRYMDGIEVLEK